MGGLSQQNLLLRFGFMPRPEMDWTRKEVITSRADVTMAQGDSSMKAGLGGFCHPNMVWPWRLAYPPG